MAPTHGFSRCLQRCQGRTMKATPSSRLRYRCRALPLPSSTSGKPSGSPTRWTFSTFKSRRAWSEESCKYLSRTTARRGHGILPTLSTGARLPTSKLLRRTSGPPCRATPTTPGRTSRFPTFARSTRRGECRWSSNNIRSPTPATPTLASWRSGARKLPPPEGSSRSRRCSSGVAARPSASSPPGRRSRTRTLLEPCSRSSPGRRRRRWEAWPLPGSSSTRRGSSPPLWPQPSSCHKITTSTVRN
mmetsp:Transcript_2005/g.4604  ORF Transcript_2005/g.4604 Transcript_2005/m.4604 type:complete len:245 (+) Transcript_2005:373-1107(+)